MGTWKRFTNEIKLEIAHKALLPGSNATSVARPEGLESLVWHFHQWSSILKTFQLSKTWSFNLLNKNNFILKKLLGEAGDFDWETVAAEIACLQNGMSNYNPECIYNMDETVLNYRL